MKDSALITAWAVNIDQRRSRRQPDRVPGALAVANALEGVILPFERTAGDELQGLVSHGPALVRLIEGLARLDATDGLGEPGWRIGIGVGGVENLTGGGTREARGPAYLMGRDAVESAATAPGHLVIRSAIGDPAAFELAEAALIMLRTVLSGRSRHGWEAVDAVSAGDSQAEVAARLEVSESAVSQRLARAAWRESVRGSALAAALLESAGKTVGPAT